MLGTEFPVIPRLRFTPLAGNVSALAGNDSRVRQDFAAPDTPVAGKDWCVRALRLDAPYNLQPAGKRSIGNLKGPCTVRIQSEITRSALPKQSLRNENREISVVSENGIGYTISVRTCLPNSGCTMKRLGLSVAFLALLFVILPTLTAQDAKKKAADKAEKKDDAKDPDAKKAKDPEEKSEKKKKEEPPKKEKLNYGYKFTSKIIAPTAAAIASSPSRSRKSTRRRSTRYRPGRRSGCSHWPSRAQVAQQFAQANQQTNAQQRLNSLQNAARSQANYRATWPTSRSSSQGEEGHLQQQAIRGASL